MNYQQRSRQWKTLTSTYPNLVVTDSLATSSAKYADEAVERLRYGGPALQPPSPSRALPPRAEELRAAAYEFVDHARKQPYSLPSSSKDRLRNSYFKFTMGALREFALAVGEPEPDQVIGANEDLLVKATFKFVAVLRDAGATGEAKFLSFICSGEDATDFKVLQGANACDFIPLDERKKALGPGEAKGAEGGPENYRTLGSIDMALESGRLQPLPGMQHALKDLEKWYLAPPRLYNGVPSRVMHALGLWAPQPRQLAARALIHPVALDAYPQPKLECVAGTLHVPHGAIQGFALAALADQRLRNEAGRVGLEADLVQTGMELLRQACAQPSTKTVTCFKNGSRVSTVKDLTSGTLRSHFWHGTADAAVLLSIVTTGDGGQGSVILRPSDKGFRIFLIRGVDPVGLKPDPAQEEEIGPELEGQLFQQIVAMLGPNTELSAAAE